MLDNPLRILHVVVNMNRGGAETLLMNLYRKIDRKIIQFDFLTFKPGVFDEEIEDLGGIDYRLPYVTDVGHMQFIKQLQQFFLTHSQYKIVHAHMDKMSGFVLRAAKNAHIPIRIAHSHNTKSEGSMLKKLYKWYSGTNIHTSATHYYACSKHAADWLFQNRPSNVHILKNGIDVNRFQFSSNTRQNVRKELAIKRDTFVLGHIGRFTEQKNHLYLIELFENVLKRFPNVKLILVGDGELRKKIEETIMKRKLSNDILLLGIRPDTHRILQAFDVLVFPSLHEGLPITLLEAQAAGLPCVISDVITREIDLGAGLVTYVPLHDQRTWIYTIKKFYQHTRSRPFPMKQFVEKGFHIDAVAKELIESYKQLGANV